MKAVFVNPERCIGCRQCEYACAVEHSQSRDPLSALLEDPPPRSRIHVEAGPSFHSSFPNRCRHCNPAPCQQVCPTAAIYRDAQENLVLVHARKCIACALCAMVCPFDALTFHLHRNGMPPRVTATKCDGCWDRVQLGLTPGCVEACKTQALVYGELNELIQSGRLRESGQVLAATAGAPTAPMAPETVRNWRAWGEAAAKLAGGAS